MGETLLWTMSVQFPPGVTPAAAPPVVTLPPGAAPIAKPPTAATPIILMPPNASPIPAAVPVSTAAPGMMEEVPRSPTLSPAGGPQISGEVADSAFDLQPSAALQAEPSPQAGGWGLWSSVTSAANNVSTSETVGSWVSWGSEKAAAAASTAIDVANATKEVANAVAEDQRQRFRTDVARYGGIDEA